MYLFKVKQHWVHQVFTKHIDPYNVTISSLLESFLEIVLLAEKHGGNLFFFVTQ